MLNEGTVTIPGEITGAGFEVLRAAGVAKNHTLVECVYLNEPLSLQIDGLEVCGTAKANESVSLIGNGFVLLPGQELKVVKMATVGGPALFCVTLTPVGRFIGAEHEE